MHHEVSFLRSHTFMSLDTVMPWSGPVAQESGGRFLNTKQQLQEQNQQYQASSGSMCSKTIGNSIISQSGPICTPSSDAAGASAASQDRGCLPSVGFRPTANFSDQGGGGSKLVVNGMQQRVSTIRWREVGTTPFPGAHCLWQLILGFWNYGYAMDM